MGVSGVGCVSGCVFIYIFLRLGLIFLKCATRFFLIKK